MHNVYVYMKSAGALISLDIIMQQRHTVASEPASLLLLRPTSSQVLLNSLRKQLLPGQDCRVRDILSSKTSSLMHPAPSTPSVVAEPFLGHSSLEVGLASDDDANDDPEEPKRTAKDLHDQDLHKQGGVLRI